MPGRIERSRRLSGDTRYGGHGESVEPEQKNDWEDQGTPACQEPLKAAEQILYKLRVATAVETQLDILESGWDRLVNIPQSMEGEVGKRS